MDSILDSEKLQLPTVGITYLDQTSLYRLLGLLPSIEDDVRIGRRPRRMAGDNEIATSPESRSV
jgi:hypothetical protein